MKQQDKEMFGENNEIGAVAGHAGIFIFYGVVLILIGWGISKLI